MRLAPARPDQDRIALGWPSFIGGVVQAAHYQWRLNGVLYGRNGLYGASCMVPMAPTPGLAILCRHGPPSQQLMHRHRMAIELMLCSPERDFGVAKEEGRACCVTNRILAQYVARLCGDPVDAADARRQVRAMLLLVSPDKVQGLAAQVPGRQAMTRACGRAAQALLFYRDLLDDPAWSAAIFAPGRLSYGQDGGPLGRCLAAVFSVLAAWVAVAQRAWTCVLGEGRAAERAAPTFALEGARKLPPSHGVRLGIGLRPRLATSIPERLKGLDGFARSLRDAAGPSSPL